MPSAHAKRRDRRRGLGLRWVGLLSLLLAAPLAGASTMPIDVVFVLDNSGSMRGHDPGFLTRRAVVDFAGALADDPALDGRVGVVLFDQRARLVQPLVSLREGGGAAVVAEALTALDFSGARTHGPAGIERALYELRRQGRVDARKAIVFVTDGKIDTGSAAGDAEAQRWLREDLAGESLAQGIRIFGIAFTEAADYRTLQALALGTQARYYRAFRAEELDEAVRDVLARVATDSDPRSIPEQRLTGPPPGDEAAQPATPPSAPPDVAAGPGARARRGIDGLLGWLPVVLLLGAGTLYWRHRRRAGRGPDPLAPVFEEVAAAEAQLLDFGGQIGEAGGAVTLRRGRTTIGRDPHNDIVLHDDTISSEHAIIELRRGRYWLEDRRSTNGTRLGDRRLSAGEPVQLKGGDHVRFAEIDLMFALAGYVPGGGTLILHPPTELPPDDGAPPPGASAGDEPVVADEPRGAVEAKTNPREPEAVPGATLGAPPAATGPGRHISLLPDPDPDPDPEPEPDAPRATSPEAADAAAREPYRACIDYHLARVAEISPAFESFIESAFGDELRAALTVAGRELLEAAQSSGRLEMRDYTAERIRYRICAVPGAIESARERFAEAWGGFTRLLTEALQQESFRRDACRVLAVLTFGGESARSPWVSLSVVPEEDQDPHIDLLSYEFLTDEERRDVEPGGHGVSQSGLA